MRCLVTAGKHVNNIRDIGRQPSITTIEGLLEAAFSVGSDPRLYSEETRPAQCRRPEAGSNTPTVALRVVGDEKGNLCLEV
jgi:hypothetical protein